MTADRPTGDAPPQPGARRIAFCITDLDVGGAEQCLVNVVCRLDRRLWTPHVFCLSHRGALVDRLEQSGIDCTCLNWRGWPDAWRIISLARLLRSFRPALLQTFLFHGNLAGRIAGKLAGVPVTVSGIRVAEKEKRWHVTLDRLTRRLVTCHVCVSQAVADFSIREAHLSPDTVTVIPNGVDVDRFAQAEPYSNAELSAPPDTRWMISVGRLHAQKGHRLLIEAVTPLLQARTDWRLMIVGDGPLRGELQQQIEQSGCADRIVLLGFRSDVPRLLKTASLFILPSLWEGQPNVIAEAIAAGLPVVASDVEGVRATPGCSPDKPSSADNGLVRANVTGVLVPPGNLTDLRVAIESLIAAPDELDRIAKGAQLFSLKPFTTDAMANSYSDLYARLMRNLPIVNT